MSLKNQNSLESTDTGYKQPPFPEIKLPVWIHPRIKEVVEQELAYIDRCRILPRQLYSSFVQYFNRIKAALTDPSLRKFWESIYIKSSEGTVIFVKEFFKMEWDFYCLHIIKGENKNLMIEHKKLINAARKLVKNFNQSALVQKSQDELVRTAEERILSSEAALQKCKISDMSPSKHWPYTRKKKSKKALPIFFIRRLVISFRENFNRPMHREVCNIVNIIFNTNYIETEVITLTKNTMKLPKF